MATTIRQPAALRAGGPFVTTSGRRLPVRVLVERDIPALLEFYDYLSRRSKTLQLLGMPDADRERIVALTGRQLEASPVLAIMAGPSALIRGVAQYSRTSATTAEARFTIDESLDADHVSSEMLNRLADHASEAGIAQLDMSATDGSPLLDALERSGFPFKREADSDHYSVAIAQPR